MGGKSSRTKGHSFERAIAKYLRILFPKAKRNLEYQEGQGVDLEGTGCFKFQLKRRKNYSPMTALFEVPKNDDNIPVLVTKADFKPILVAMYWDDFTKLMEVYEDPKEGNRKSCVECD